MVRSEKNTDAAKRLPGRLLWLEEAWNGWVKSIGFIALVVGAYFAYDRGVLPERLAGIAVVAAAIVGTILAAAIPSLSRLRSRGGRIAFALFVVVWAIGAGHAPLRRAIPSAVIGESIRVAHCNRWRDAEKRHCADPVLFATIQLQGRSGPYEIDVAGELGGQGEKAASYSLVLEGADGSKDRVEGVLRRVYFQQRTSRRSTGSTAIKQEHTENTHRVSVGGPLVKIIADGVDESLVAGLAVSFRPAGPDPRVLLILTALCGLVALALDVKLSGPRSRTFLTAAVGFTLAFAWNFPSESTTHHLVRPAIGSLLFSLLTGGIGGWLLAVIARALAPKTSRGTVG